jgi:hypothetical protein
VLDDAGHAPWAEQPAKTRRVIIDALSCHPGGGTRSPAAAAGPRRPPGWPPARR